MPERVLITGAAGELGGVLARRLTGRYELRLTDRHPPKEQYGAPFVAADISDLDAMLAVCDGIDSVVHLAAEPDPEASWEELLQPNIVGVRNVFEAARASGCRRIVFASSINAVAGYPGDMQVHTGQPVRPFNLYGATKAWGEALACFYAERRGLPAICLRIGWVLARDSKHLRPDHPYLPFVLTYDDLVRIVEASIAAPDALRFGIFHAISDNRWKRLDISDARTVLGYAPEDDAFALAEGMRRDE